MKNISEYIKDQIENHNYNRKITKEFMPYEYNNFMSMDYTMNAIAFGAKSKWSKDNYVYTTNGYYDLEKAGKSGYGVWVGAVHDARGRAKVDEYELSDIVNDVSIDLFVNAVNKIYKTNYQRKDVHVENRWRTTDMFRLYILK